MRFAHLADCHLGAFRDEKLRELNLLAFEKAIDRCISEKVDFIIIAGDLFHIHLPDLSVINRAVLKLHELKKSNIPLYVIYGSHDYSPTEHSMIDILQSAGIFTKVNVYESSEDKLRLKVFEDEKTKAKIVGMSARKLGLEKNYYEILDISELEKISGFKIFVFHNAVSECLNPELQKMSSIPISYFPKGFDYYAGGHIHITSKYNKSGYGWFVSPGSLFGANYTDLENSVGDPNGFFIATFEDKIKKIDFVPVKVCDIQMHDINLNHKNANEANELLKKFASENNFSEKLNLIRIHGRLASGNISDLELSDFRNKISQDSLVAYFNTHKLESADSEKITVKSESREEIEKQLFEKNLSVLKLENKLSPGIAEQLLKEIKQEILPGETRTDYESKIINSAMKVIDVNEN